MKLSQSRKVHYHQLFMVCTVIGWSPVLVILVAIIQTGHFGGFIFAPWDQPQIPKIKMGKLNLRVMLKIMKPKCDKMVMKHEK